MHTTDPKTNPPKLNVVSRLAQVWTNFNFIKLVLYAEREQAVGQTWKFWFFWNTIFVLIVCVGLFFIRPVVLEHIDNSVWPLIPEFELEITNGRLSTNLDEPFVIPFEDQGIFILDTQEVAYTAEALKSYPQGVFVNAEGLVAKEADGKIETIGFDEFEENVRLSRTQLGQMWGDSRFSIYNWMIFGFGLILWLWFCLFRLLTAVWWALVFWAYGSAWGIKDWTFGRSYLSVLNFYIIPLVFETMLLFGLIVVPFSTLIIFTLVYTLNFWWFKTSGAD